MPLDSLCGSMGMTRSTRYTLVPDEEERRKYESLVPMFELMEELAAILRNRRHKRGAVDFDFAESYRLTASSRSLASSPSMVTICSAVRSMRPALSASCRAV